MSFGPNNQDLKCLWKYLMKLTSLFYLLKFLINENHIQNESFCHENEIRRFFHDLEWMLSCK